MTLSIPFLISWISKVMTLEPGWMFWLLVRLRVVVQ
ncbi:hypothetical protein [Neobacillus ginsengisoli]|nr:hypothetical protein [Neobacillus ginsengisoli]